MSSHHCILSGRIFNKVQAKANFLSFENLSISLGSSEIGTQVITHHSKSEGKIHLSQFDK
jgi:hypothetical protein